jgi:hypothetical protein
MKKIIATFVAVSLVSSLLTTAAYAGDHRGDFLNPLWVPVVILSTIAAAVTFSEPAVVREHRVIYEQPPTVVYDSPRPYRQFRHDDRYDRYRDRGFERHRGYDYR